MSDTTNNLIDELQKLLDELEPDNDYAKELAALTAVLYGDD